MSYANVQACAEAYPVARVCEVLGLSESGYYAWLNRKPSLREEANHELKARIVGIWERFKKCYGAPRIHAE